MVINAEIREYPKDKKVEPANLTDTGIENAIYSCRLLIDELEVMKAEKSREMNVGVEDVN